MAKSEFHFRVMVKDTMNVVTLCGLHCTLKAAIKQLDSFYSETGELLAGVFDCWIEEF